MYLYLDLIWLLNFFIDYLLLWLTALFRKLECKKWRLAAAAAIGSSYVLFLFIPPLNSYYTTLIKLLLSLVIVYVAFGYGSVQRLGRSFFTFYFVSFITGGGLLAIHYILDSSHQLLQGMVATQSGGYGNSVSWLFVLIGFPLMYWFSQVQWQGIERTQSREKLFVQVEVNIGGQRIGCQGLVDTGNQLYAPFTRKPVMLMEARLFANILPQELFKMMQADRQLVGLADLELPDTWLARLSIIPYRGAGQSMEMMVTLKPDEVVISTPENEWITERVLIGLEHHSLDREGLFQAIVHPDLVGSENMRKIRRREA